MEHSTCELTIICNLCLFRKTINICWLRAIKLHYHYIHIHRMLCFLMLIGFTIIFIGCFVFCCYHRAILTVDNGHRCDWMLRVNVSVWPRGRGFCDKAVAESYSKYKGQVREVRIYLNMKNKINKSVIFSLCSFIFLLESENITQLEKCFSLFFYKGNLQRNLF